MFYKTKNERIGGGVRVKLNNFWGIQSIKHHKNFKTREEKNQYVADTIKNWLLENNVGGDTRIYFNGMCYSSSGYGENTTYKLLKNKRASDYTKYANNETVTVTFEGDFYSIMNYNYCTGLRDSFDELIKKLGYHYELGEAWNISLYEN
jgi:hypothetical protein